MIPSRGVGMRRLITIAGLAIGAVSLTIPESVLFPILFVGGFSSAAAATIVPVVAITVNFIISTLLECGLDRALGKTATAFIRVFFCLPTGTSQSKSRLYGAARRRR